LALMVDALVRTSFLLFVPVPAAYATTDVAVDHGIFGELTFLKGIEVLYLLPLGRFYDKLVGIVFMNVAWPGHGSGGADCGRGQPRRCAAESRPSAPPAVDSRQG
jgi:hypothetical protein